MNTLQKYKEHEIYFLNADHVDVKTIESDVDLRCFVAGMLSYHPWWIVFLFGVRALFARILGLARHERSGTLSVIQPEDLSFQPGESASFFTVRDAKEGAYWIAETPKDKHLKAFFGVMAETSPLNRSRYHVFTSVRYLHWTGPVYFNVIRPFHHMVVWRMMKAGIKNHQTA
jgi:hypothetical protein